MTLYPIPFFSDNYIWALVREKQVLMVDPGDADVALNWLQQHQLTLHTIFVTHHHPDHTGGVAQLHRQTGAEIYAPATEWLKHELPCTRVSATTHRACQMFGLNWHVFDVPGHTLGHVAYWCADVSLAGAGVMPVLFCGDTLFSGGCGRLFEGTAEAMYASLQQLAALPANTLVCAAHEYTLSNLKFAQAVDPSNPILESHRLQCEQKRSLGHPTLPSTLHTEREINPFLRVSEPAIQQAAATRRHQDPSTIFHPESVFAVLREWKNHF